MAELIKSESLGIPLNDNYNTPITEEQGVKLYNLSKMHDLCHVVGSAIQKNKLLSERDKICGKFDDQVFKAIGRYERINHELKNLCEVLENAKIPFIPLKGSVLRSYYKEPWLRASCDIDIFVYEKNVDNAIDALVKELNYKAEGTFINEKSVFSPSGVHIEMHYLADKSKRTEICVLDDVWGSAVPVEGKTYQRAMSWEYFYLYHIAHMAKHFESSGCGIRPFLDIIIMNNCLNIDSEKKNELLSKYSLSNFATSAEHLADVWFNGAEHTDLTQKMSEYIVKAGVYGDRENWVTVQQMKNGHGGKRHVLRRLWVPYEDLKVIYPSLEGKKWLIPLYQIRKWFRIFKSGALKRGLKEIKISSAVTDEKKQETKNMFIELGLNVKK